MAAEIKSGYGLTGDTNILEVFLKTDYTYQYTLTSTGTVTLTSVEYEDEGDIMQSCKMGDATFIVPYVKNGPGAHPRTLVRITISIADGAKYTFSFDE